MHTHDYYTFETHTPWFILPKYQKLCNSKIYDFVVFEQPYSKSEKSPDFEWGNSKFEKFHNFELANSKNDKFSIFELSLPEPMLTFYACVCVLKCYGV